ncbi:MAG: hypothetical protein AB3N13_08750 [Arenibacterium sp.]
MTATDIARRTGVSLDMLKKLKQIPDRKTNVEDARKIANYFDQTLEEFIANPGLEGPLRIVSAYSQLPEALQKQLEAYAEGLAHSHLASSSQSREDSE